MNDQQLQLLLVYVTFVFLSPAYLLWKMWCEHRENAVPGPKIHNSIWSC